MRPSPERDSLLAEILPDIAEKIEVKVLTEEEYKKKIADLQTQLRKKNKQEPITRNIDVINIKEEEKARKKFQDLEI